MNVLGSAAIVQSADRANAVLLSDTVTINLDVEAVLQDDSSTS
jgi:hypothetical protein